jgi:CheY-like chemotaxis protein
MGVRMHRVLIAEDEALVALGLAELMASAGHSVVAVVPRADVALDIATRHRPDLCLFDLRLADGTDGLAAALQVQNRLHLPVIVISATIDDRRAQSWGVRHWLPKPVDARRLLQMIPSVCAERPANQSVNPPIAITTGTGHSGTLSGSTPRLVHPDLAFGPRPATG